MVTDLASDFVACGCGHFDASVLPAAAAFGLFALDAGGVEVFDAAGVEQPDGVV
jgi:hypothetical protein